MGETFTGTVLYRTSKGDAVKLSKAQIQALRVLKACEDYTWIVHPDTGVRQSTVQFLIRNSFIKTNRFGQVKITKQGLAYLADYETDIFKRHV
jgi:hypothetical protein